MLGVLSIFTIVALTLGGYNSLEADKQLLAQEQTDARVQPLAEPDMKYQHALLKEDLN
ncbi:MAG: hypothetical protein GY703_16735 [Gammaproteobacteria bacterium]|nr:hypothetical protein [Gammaproteobacteria bacterium]